MKNRLHLIIIVVTFFFLSNCQTDQNNKSQQNNTRIINIKGESILKKEYGAMSIAVVDTLILVYIKGSKDFYHIYNANTLNYIGRLGKRGNGPSEWSAPHYSGQYIKTDSAILIWINDVFKYRFMLVNVTKSLKQNIPVVEKEYRHSPNFYLTQDLLYVNDFKLVGTLGMDAIEKGRLCLYNPILNSVQITNLFPKISNQNNFNTYDLYQIYFDDIRLKPDRSLLVSAMNTFDRIDIFDTTGNVIKSIIGNEVKIDGIKNKKNSELVGLTSYYEDIYLSDEYIYTLYYNQPVKDYGEIFIPTEIRVFDYTGNQLFCLKTEDYLMTFSVDENNGWIYGVDYFNEKILKYNIQGIFTDDK